MNSEAEKTSRPQRILHLFPAAVVLVVYAFLFALPKQRDYQAGLRQYEQVDQISVTQERADQARESLRNAREKLQNLRDGLADDRLRIRELSQEWRSPETRLETVKEITEMMGDFDLSIVSQDYVTEPNISEYFRNLTQVINEQSPNAPPIEFWEIKLEGAYLDVQDFLQKIDIEKMQAFPLTLTMEGMDGNEPESGLLQWTVESNNGMLNWTIIFVV